MQNPFDVYQQNKAVQPQKKVKKPKAPKRRSAPPRSKAKTANRKNNDGMVISMIFASLAGLGLSFYIFAYTDQFIDLLNRVEVGYSQANAADSAKSSTKKAKSTEVAEPLPVGKVSQLTSESENLTMKNTSVYRALKEKHRELEKKERRLAQLEEELQLQKIEIERQLKEMKEMRQNISQKLDRKVAADQQSVDKLVGVYANMKPQNAAMIITTIDEELAIKVLGKMKKQNAAAILNYVNPKKAQVLSEKFTGLKN